LPEGIGLFLGIGAREQENCNEKGKEDFHRVKVRNGKQVIK
jgi:hypothetical protein